MKPEFIGTKDAIDARYFQLARLVRENGTMQVDVFFKKIYESVFESQSAKKIIETTEFKSLRTRLGNSMVASIIDKSVSVKTKSLITDVL